MAVSCKGAHVPQEIMLPCVRWYVASPLSPRQGAERLLTQGVHVDHATVNRWVLTERPQRSRKLRRLSTSKRPETTGRPWPNCNCVPPSDPRRSP
jgi:putative transposase